MIMLYKKNTPNITSLLYGFHDCREIKVSRKIGKKRTMLIQQKLSRSIAQFI